MSVWVAAMTLTQHVGYDQSSGATLATDVRVCPMFSQ